MQSQAWSVTSAMSLNDALGEPPIPITHRSPSRHHSPLTQITCQMSQNAASSLPHHVNQDTELCYIAFYLGIYKYLDMYMGDSIVGVRDIHRVFFKFVAAKKVTDKFSIWKY